MAQLIKKAAMEAVVASKPCDILIGRVVSVNPIAINIDQKLTLTIPFLIIGASVKETLTNGDNVIMVRAQGGQKYYVMDKVV
ncbi:MAG TPA: DUF2577 domain-containing protein [Lachnospiraceae bacterium]|nr:DUF2577 domain-containing protein [Lachnospiraceae bacterium]